MTEMTLQQAFELGDQFQRSGQFKDAESIYRQILAREPEQPHALHMLGIVFAQTGRTADAIDMLRHSIRLNPSVPQAFNNLGNVLKQAGQFDEAIGAFTQSLTLDPNSPEPYNNLGSTLAASGRLDEGIASIERAIALQPRLPGAYNNLGNALFRAGRREDAVGAYRRAVMLEPNAPVAYYNLANALSELGQYNEAIASYRQALVVQPAFPEALNNLANALRDVGQLREAQNSYAQALSLRNDPQIASALLFSLYLDPDYSPQSAWPHHERWEQVFAAPLVSSIRPHLNDRAVDRRLRVGYVSPDFRDHPVGRFILPLLARHDRENFKVYCYSNARRPDAMTERIAAHADEWKNTAGIPDEALADQIREDGIDILVDLALHADGNRLLVFARKPAPVQVSYLQYLGTTGLKTIDYRFTDPYLDPPEGNDKYYSERSVRLRSYWCYQPPQEAPEVTPLPAQTAGHVTFGCLNYFGKVNGPTLLGWARVLNEVPGSRLIVHVPESVARLQIREMMAKQGISSERLQFVVRLPFAQYLAQYNSIDIGLDPVPYTGGTTTCDALWMGIPVVSFAGPTAVSRGGLSILSHIGLPEMVAREPQDYMKIAKDLANDLPRLAELRSGMRERMRNSPLMDAAGYARDVEAAYQQMWRTWVEGAGSR